MSARISFRHFLVQDAAACRHPLHVARPHPAAIAETIAVLDRGRRMFSE
jgi:hypothetical protein